MKGWIFGGAGLGMAFGLAVLPPASAPAAGPAGGVQPVSQCRAGEQVLYSCQFGKSVGSVCAGAASVHYRYGAPGQPGLDLANKPDWSNVHTGTVRGQGTGGYQEHVRFTNGQTHYIVFSGMDGELASHPGRTYSGIAVQSGPRGEKALADLACAGKPRMTGSLADAVNARALADVDLSEESDGPFDAWF